MIVIGRRRIYMRKLAGKVVMVMMVLFMAGMLSVHAEAMMHNPGDGWQDWMDGHWGPPGGSGGGINSYMWGGNDSWMMKGMLSAPVVGDDGTAYIVRYASSISGMVSRISSYGLDGSTADVALRGKVSVPVPQGAYLFATTSGPILSDYDLTGNYGTNPAGEQSVLFRLPAPFGANAIPDAVTLDGRIASKPVISSNRIYVTTKDPYYGKKYLYVLNPDLTLVTKTLIQ
jgi:hypothetical protein